MALPLQGEGSDRESVSIKEYACLRCPGLSKTQPLRGEGQRVGGPVGGRPQLRRSGFVKLLRELLVSVEASKEGHQGLGN